MRRELGRRREWGGRGRRGGSNLVCLNDLGLVDCMHGLVFGGHWRCYIRVIYG
jgi:hypothetical protein